MIYFALGIGIGLLIGAAVVVGYIAAGVKAVVEDKGGV